MKRAKIGDIIEFKTKMGFAYAQFSHYHSFNKSDDHGALLRILPGTFSQRPAAFEELASTKEVYFTFFPVQAAVNRSLVAVVGQEEVPVHAREFPLFRCGTPSSKTGKVSAWWLWDGKKEWKVGQLTDQQWDLPIRVIPSYPLLVERIEQGWTPRRDEEFIERARAEAKQIEKAAAVGEMRHFLVFKDQGKAEKAAEMIRGLNMQAQISNLDEEWGVSVLQPSFADGAVELVTETLEEIASAGGGIYDGNEVKVR